MWLALALLAALCQVLRGVRSLPDLVDAGAGEGAEALRDLDRHRSLEGEPPRPAGPRYVNIGETPSALGVVGVLLSASGVYLLNVSRASLPLAALFFPPSVITIKKAILLGMMLLSLAK